jgi:hypothetical protein
MYEHIIIATVTPASILLELQWYCAVPLAVFLVIIIHWGLSRQKPLGGVLALPFLTSLVIVIARECVMEMNAGLANGTYQMAPLNIFFRDQAVVLYKGVFCTFLLVLIVWAWKGKREKRGIEEKGTSSIK